MVQSAPVRSEINTNPTHVRPSRGSKKTTARVSADVRGSVRGADREVVEVGFGVVVYPPGGSSPGGVWRAVYAEGGTPGSGVHRVRRHEPAVTRTHGSTVGH